MKDVIQYKDFIGSVHFNADDSIFFGHKSYKGNFNIRITPELHKKALHKALLKGISLNQFVQQAIEHEIADKDN